MKKGLFYKIIILQQCLMLFISLDTAFSIPDVKEISKDYIIDSNVAKEEIEVKESVFDELNSYQKESKQVIGLIKILDSDINSTINQGKDNEYYLNHNYKNDYFKGGTVFMDYRNNINSKYMLLYGHNSKYRTLPFKKLERYYDYDYYKDHKYIMLVFNKEIKYYEIFSVYVEAKDWTYYNKINFKSNDKFIKQMNKYKNKSIYKTNVEINKNDKVLILQTCSHKKEYEKYENKFLLIYAKEINKGDLK